MGIHDNLLVTLEKRQEFDALVEKVEWATSVLRKFGVDEPFQVVVLLEVNLDKIGLNTQGLVRVLRLDMAFDIDDVLLVDETKPSISRVQRKEWCRGVQELFEEWWPTVKLGMLVKKHFTFPEFLGVHLSKQKKNAFGLLFNSVFLSHSVTSFEG